MVQFFDRFILGFEPAMPVPSGVLVEGGLGVMTAQPVVDLPGDKLRMLAQRVRQAFNDFFRITPKDVAVQADRSAGALVFEQSALVDGQYFRMLPGQPDRRGGGWGGQYHL